MNVVMGGAEARRGRVITTLHLFKKIMTIISLCWVFVAAGFSLVAVSRGYSLVAMHGLLITAASPVAEPSKSSVVLVLGFSCPLATLAGPLAGSSQTRD